MAKRRKFRKPICPSCGQPVGSGFPLVKTALVILLLGYILASNILLRVSMCRNEFATSLDNQLRPLFSQPVFQIIVIIGLAAGLLIFYWDWFEDLYMAWKEKRGDSPETPEKEYRYKCRFCGHEWN
jgi:hypothetical protein